MRQIAVWITARRRNAFAVIASLLAIAPILAGAILACAVIVLVALVRGLKDAASLSVGAVALVLVVIAFTQQLQAPVVVYLCMVAAVGLTISWALLKLRSLVLVAQLATILILVGISFFFMVSADPLAVWDPAVDYLINSLFQVGQVTENAEIALKEARQVFTGFAAWMMWLALMMAVWIGHGLYVASQEGGSSFGRFRDLNLGRAVAVITVVIAVAGGITDSLWLTNMGLALLLVYFVQGLALTHAAIAILGWPPMLVTIAYLAVLVFAPIAATLSVVGYLDSWMDLRSKLANKKLGSQ